MKAAIRIAPASILALSALTLVACGQRPTRDEPPPAPEPATAPAQPSMPPAAPTPPAASQAPTDGDLPTFEGRAEFTGVAVCDEYLASYRACHAVLGTASDAVERRLESLRNHWQTMARDPDQRDTLVAQCQNVTDTMNDALDGRECVAPASDFYEPDGS